MSYRRFTCSICGAKVRVDITDENRTMSDEELVAGVGEIKGGKFVCKDCVENVFFCAVCQCYHDVEQRHVVRDTEVCDECFNSLPVCANCGEVLLPGEVAHEHDGDPYCQACFEECFVECAHCDNYVLREDTYKDYNGDLICERCRNQDYFVCRDCGELYPRDEAFYIQDIGESVCENCYENGEYGRCEGCEDYFRSRSLNEDGYCRECRDDDGCPNRMGVHDYHWGHHGWISGRPFVSKSQGERSYRREILTYGVEVEMDDGDFDYNSMGDGDKLYHFEEDGSLGYEGVELITQPCSLKFHRFDFPWRKVLAAAKKCGFRSHNTSCCGLHVHIGRAGLSSSDIIKLDLFINKFFKNWKRLARRESGWARADSCKTPHDCIYSYRHACNDHHMAVNHGNRNTVEIRIARGSLRFETVLGTIECYDAAIHFLRSIGIFELYHAIPSMWDKFVEFVSSKPEDYPEAIEMMSRLGKYEPAKIAHDNICIKKVKKDNWLSKEEDEQ